MVQILEGKPGLGALFGAGLGQGLQGGMQTGMNYAMQLGLERAKHQQTADLYKQFQSPKPQGDLDQQFIQGLNTAAPQIESMLGREMTPDDVSKLWNSFQQTQQQNVDYDKLAEAYTMSGYPQKGAVLSQLERNRLNREKFQYEKQRGEREVFTDVKNFWNTIGEEREKIPALESSLDAQMDAVLKGDVDPWSRGHFADIARGLGAPSSLVASLETPGSKEFKTARKTYLASTLKDAFKGNTTTAEIDLADSLLSQAGTSKEGNLASIWLLQSKLMIDKERIRIASQLRKQGVSGYEIPDMVFEQLQPVRAMLAKQYMEAIKEISSKK